MIIDTRIFGEIEINEDKIIIFKGGIIGFPGLKKFMLIHNEETKNKNIIWLQSLDEPEFALPVIDPLVLDKEYNPAVEEDMLGNIGELKSEDMLVLVTLTIPEDLTKMTTNLKAPIIINSSSLKACQIIVEDDKYSVKHPIYHIIKGSKEESEC